MVSRLVAEAAVTFLRAGLGMKVMDAGKDYFTETGTGFAIFMNEKH